MKRFFLFVIVSALVLSISPSVFASRSTDSSVNVEVNHKYMFSYTENVLSDHRIVRTYSKSAQSSQGSVACAYAYSTTAQDSETDRTEAILSSLGMSSDFVEELSEDDLNTYAEAERITSTVTYTKMDIDGNVTNVSEDEALQASTYGAIKEETNFGGDGSLSESKVVTDEYMKLVFVVTYLGDARYRYSIDAEWLTMPLWRYTDCLGAAAQRSATCYGSASGWYKYNVSIVTPTETTNVAESYTFSEDDFVSPTTDGWDGRAVTFNLPDDSVVASEYDTTMRYSGFKVHLQYDALVDTPELAVNFNAVASYSHTMVVVIPGAGVDIGTDSIAGAWSFNLAFEEDIRVATFDNPLQYEPD